MLGLIADRREGECLDDFFITFRYAENLASGQGFTFNPPERVFGLSNPGFGLLLALGGWATGLPIPVLATWSTALSLLILAGALLLDLQRRGRAVEGVLAGSLLVGSSYIWACHGGEMTVVLALLAVAGLLLQARPGRAGVIAGLAAWCRPEAMLAVPLLIWLAWRRRRTSAVPFLCAALLVVAAGAVAAWAYFGHPWPVTLAAKRAMALTSETPWTGVRFWPRAARLLDRHWGPAWHLVLGLGVLGLVSLLRRGGPAARVVGGFGLVLAAAYPLLGVPFFAWYAVPSLTALLCGYAFLAGSAGRWGWEIASRRGGRPLITGTLAGAVLLPGVLSLAPAAWSWHRHREWPSHMRAYRDAGHWLRLHTQPEDSVAYYEIGALGYFSRRPIVDLLGIVTPELIPYVRSGDLADAFLARPARYAVFHSGRGGWMPIGHRWFRRAYREVARLPDGEERLVIFRRRARSRLPAPDRAALPTGPH